jgi:hypothetical protein
MWLCGPLTLSDERYEGSAKQKKDSDARHFEFAESMQVLKGYVGGMINDALDAATAPMEKVMDGLIGIGGKIFAGTDTLALT